MRSHILTVSRLTAQLKNTLETGFPDLWIEGEISNLTIPQSGHAYFTLKDQHAQIRAVMFRSALRFLKFTLQHGIEVVCRGRISVYEPRGEYQLVLEYIEPKGAGALQVAYEQLKARLELEGLFDMERKKSLPMLPSRIGIVTSPTGAAVRDILRVIKRRHPRMRITLFPVPVQGAEAAPAIVEAIGYFNARQAVDVIIIGRGGGSIEDLWAFNEEAVARAIAASAIPIISAVGHETDFTISDFVADLRAPTPSAAAEMVVESEAHFRQELYALETRMVRAVRQALQLSRAVVQERMRLLGDPARTVERHRLRVDELMRRARISISHRVQMHQMRLNAAADALSHLSPLGVLARGYSVTMRAEDGAALKDVSRLEVGTLIESRLLQGTITSRVEHVSTTATEASNVRAGR